MKKLLGVIAVIFLIGSLVACSNHQSNPQTNSILATDLSARETTILSTVTSESFVFDFNNSDYQEVEVWIEKYEDGELVDDQLGYMTAQIGEKGSIVLASPKTSNHEKQQSFLIGTGDENGTSSASVVDDNLQDADLSLMVSSSLTEEKTLDEGEIVLANIAYSNNEFGISSISNQFFEDPEGNMDELKEYEVVYLYKVAFVE